MPLRPHELKTLKDFLASVSARLGELQGELHQLNDSVSNQHIANRESNREGQHEIHEAIDELANKQDHASNASDSRQNRRHWQNLSVQVILAFGTLGAFIAACVYADISNRQLSKMRESYGEMRNQTYLACLNAQAAQRTFIQVERSGVDSHASAAASIQQAAEAIESQRAVVSMDFRIPVIPDEIWNNELSLPYTIRNEGKSSAKDFKAVYKAVLVPESAPFKPNMKYAETDTAPNLIAGRTYPDKPIGDKSQLRAITTTAYVIEPNGTHVQMGSRDAMEFLAGGSQYLILVYGNISYGDSSGEHYERFCYPTFLIKPGTTHITPQSAKDCTKYSQKKDVYKGIPDVPPLQHQEEIAPIVCEKPED